MRALDILPVAHRTASCLTRLSKESAGEPEIVDIDQSSSVTWMRAIVAHPMPSLASEVEAILLRPFLLRPL